MNQNIDPLILKSLPFDPLPGDFDLSRRESYRSEIGRKACFSLLRRLLKDKRYFHSISVGSLCELAAIEQGMDVLNARWAGVLHDLAKRVAKGEKGKALMEKYYPEYADLPDWTYHQFLGALLAKELFGVDNPDVLDAICFHATGKKDMCRLGKLVYACDKIDPLRGYDSSDMIKAVTNDVDKGFVYVLDENRKYYRSKGFEPERMTKECFAFYLKEKG